MSSSDQISSTNISEESVFTQEQYNQFFQLMQTFFNIKTDLKHAVQNMQKSTYKRPETEEYEKSVKKAYETSCEWCNAMDEAVSKIAEDQKTYKWLSKAVADFKADIAIFKQLNKL